MAARMGHISNNFVQKAICFLENAAYMSLLRNSSTQRKISLPDTHVFDPKADLSDRLWWTLSCAELWRHKILLQIKHVYDKNNLDSGMASSISMIQVLASVLTDSETHLHEYIRKEVNEHTRQIWIPKCPI